MKNFDFLIVGAGLYGSVFAREMTDAGKKCLVIDKRNHQGGNLYCENIEGINVHSYGPHIFHTNDKSTWDYVNSFVAFNSFIYSPLASFDGNLYNLPFNMNTFYQLWKVKTPLEAEQKIKEQIHRYGIINPKNLEEQAISMVGTEIYEMFIRGYTEKQWGRKACELPKSIIKRLPVRLTYDNNYYSDKYQGVPIGGYNQLISKLLRGSEVRLGVNFFEQRELSNLASCLLFTGKLDEFYQYKFGHLEYRSLKFEYEVLNIANYQGVAVINYTDKKTPYTRIIEHKHFEYSTHDKTVISKESSEEWTPGKEAYYPINDIINERKLKQYMELVRKESNVIFGGRLAEYKYYDMHQIVASARKKAKLIIEINNI